MSTPAVCPNGHDSQASDYCDTCGAPISQNGAAAGGAATPDGGATASTPEAEPETCPSCGADKAASALFCEACGYDFTTGTMPRSTQPVGEGAVEAEGQATADAGASASAPTPLAQPIGAEWVVEVWVDPDWYSSQGSSDPCPSPGLPSTVLLRAKSVLVGRPSTSRNIHPEVDLTGDPGVSRRQAQLTTDGQRWWVEDLQSSNGTYVGPASGPLPVDPIAPGTRHEFSEDDRVYVGAWTRLVVRRATPEEQ
ncbi:FHA domain-containing protein [Ornithinibacter aureus]|uniref:FHA domain-containing protein n=1 Tax=Ornithinibacter aureus TaxID=622664 RepID=A0ABP8JA00_9MICO|nr:FHA domain-containing protein [Ornithinibacter aureus]KAF0832835.1 double zinc ribbon protein [Ornithinibacter aureus]